MKVGVIAKPNKKGQIVIPKKVRDALGIREDVSLNIVVRGNGMYIHPIQGVIGGARKEGSYLTILEKTKGAWRGDSWLRTGRRRERLERAAAESRRQVW